MPSFLFTNHSPILLRSPLKNSVNHAWAEIALPIGRFAKRLTTASVILLATIAGGLPVSAETESESTPHQNSEPVQFNRDVRPILAEYCFACHGLDESTREAGLRLDRREDAIDMGAILPGDPESSQLVARIFSEEEWEVMPPPESKKSLTEEEKQILVRWVEQDAVYEKHWAFIAPQSPIVDAGDEDPIDSKSSAAATAKSDLPRASDADLAPVESGRFEWERGTGPIDQIVWQRLNEAGLDPNPPADARTLFRRVHFDITGLPPTPEDSDQFVAEYEVDGDAALSTWIDRLMSSPAWGEHRARYWLDAARYADTHGMHRDNFRSMWPYRDWVIRSFNRNQPFDEFVIEQLAGDLLENPTTDQLIATGFQRCSMTTNEGGTIKEENLAMYASDRVQTFGWVFMGLTTNCCQCHDHKFDPISIKDYYSLAAFFRNTTQPAMDRDRADGGGPFLQILSDADRKRVDGLKVKKDRLAEQLEQRRAAAADDYRQWLTGAGITEASDLLPSDAKLTVDVAAVADSSSQESVELAIHSRDPSGRLTSETLAFGGRTIDDRMAANVEDDVEEDDANEDDTDQDEVGREATDQAGVAVVFDKENTVDLGDRGGFAVDQAFSHSEWIHVEDTDMAAGIVARMDLSDGYRGWDLHFNNGRLTMHLIEQWPVKALRVQTSKKVIKRNRWHHIAVTYDGSATKDSVEIFVDGQRQMTTTSDATLEAGSNVVADTPLRLGRRSNLQEVFAGGSVDDFRLFDRVLQPQEIFAMAEQRRLAEAMRSFAQDPTSEDCEPLRDFYLRFVDHDAIVLQDQLANIKFEIESAVEDAPVTLIQEERDDRPAMGNILMRGEYDAIGPEVLADTPEALHPMDPQWPKNRLGLAYWVVDPANPLTARVTVNRFWQQLFGTGIVETAEDFGVMGTPPTHPELIDYLATDFIRNGWDVKRLFKQMMMSATYRQSAEVTPEKLQKDRFNHLLSRGPRFRMDAEMIRDSALAASGLLSSEMFGPGVKPYQPTNIWNMVGLPGSNTRDYQRDDGDDLYRRSIYIFWKRMAPLPSLESFNAPNREVCTVRRERTNSPMQALVTLNDTQFFEAARHLAQTVLSETHGKASETIDRLFRRVVGRPPSPKEIASLETLYEDLRVYYDEHPDDAAQVIAVGQSPIELTTEPSDLAAWTLTANSILNLDETLNK